MSDVNEFGQPVGEPVGLWAPPPLPQSVALSGSTTVLEPLEWTRHGHGLFAAFSTAGEDLWTYMTFGPFPHPDALRDTIDWMASQEDWVPYAFVVDGKPLGFASYLRIDPSQGVIEIGAIVLSPRLQRSVPATESLYLMIRNVFDLGYRRCEWKCDSLNEPSRQAGERLGFRYEGTFRKAMHYKGRNRDTAWFAITDDEWPSLDLAYRRWLSEDNFDMDGRQSRRLGELIEETRI